MFIFSYIKLRARAQAYPHALCLFCPDDYVKNKYLKPSIFLEKISRISL